LVWEGVRDINGTPMRAHIHRRPQPLGGGEDTSIYGGALPEPVTVALSTSEYVRIAPGNAALIAASPTIARALLGFVREVQHILATKRDEVIGARGLREQDVVRARDIEQAARKWIGGA